MVVFRAACLLVLGLGQTATALASARRGPRPVKMTTAATEDQAPLLLRAARGEKVWMMRQAGRHMAAYRALVEKYPTFRDRSENPEAALEISLQPWRAYAVDGVILFSDILTPLPAMGVDFDISEGGAIKIKPVRTREDLDTLRRIDVETAAPFVGEVLGKLRKEVGNSATVLGFIGLPFTLATYLVEGKTGTKTGFSEVAKMREEDPDLLMAILDLLTANIADYACYQIDSGAQVIQIFDSWAGHLPEAEYKKFALPYQQEVVRTIKERHPETPVIIYMAPDDFSKDGKLLHLMSQSGADIVSLDHTVDLASDLVNGAVPAKLGLQGNLDSKLLRDGPLEAIEKATKDILTKGHARSFHLMNLGHGIEPDTPEPHAAFFVKTVQEFHYADLDGK